MFHVSRTKPIPQERDVRSRTWNLRYPAQGQEAAKGVFLESVYGPVSPVQEPRLCTAFFCDDLC